ncbi:uncharacterized protein LOC132558047 [Ylistrum balloti]|uniref:uncharacterized protein LOC132558047 n=1 Tax=Ylistrum balloti TaxID=509963 RepID=UPI002905CE6E|nr:uncharacterized protein LOC132558047 [Ylistrum balloti]
MGDTGNQTVCSDYLVSGLHGVEDEKLTSSSNFADDPLYHGPRNARLHYNLKLVGAHSWVAGSMDTHQYIQVQFQRKISIETILLQGRNGSVHNQFVKTFSVSYSNDGVTWTDVKSQNQDPIIFVGNRDKSSVVRVVLGVAVSASYLRINPKSWNSFISLRFDVGGCYKIERKNNGSELYQNFSMMASVDLEQYPVLKEQCRSTCECGKLCLQANSCYAFTFHKDKSCRDLTMAFTSLYSKNTESEKAFAKRDVFEALRFQEFASGFGFYKVIERSLNQADAADLCRQHYSQLIRITAVSQISSLWNVIAGNTILLQDNNRLFVSGMFVSPEWKYSDGSAVMNNIWSGQTPDPGKATCKSDGDLFVCRDGQCVDQGVVCDGQGDCQDSSDEDYSLCFSLIDTTREELINTKTEVSVSTITTDFTIISNENFLSSTADVKTASGDVITASNDVTTSPASISVLNDDAFSTKNSTVLQCTKMPDVVSRKQCIHRYLPKVQGLSCNISSLAQSVFNRLNYTDTKNISEVDVLQVIIKDGVVFF